MREWLPLQIWARQIQIVVRAGNKTDQSLLAMDAISLYKFYKVNFTPLHKVKEIFAEKKTER